MKLHKNEVATGIVVVITTAVFIGFLLFIGAPGVVKPLKKYRIFVVNAAGLKPGSSVLLAGRKIGEVNEITSPVPLRERPKGFEAGEVLLEIGVDRDAAIYNRVQVRVRQLGLLGEEVIDFTKGDEASGLAEPGATYIAQRPVGVNEAASEIVEMVRPAIGELTKTLQDFHPIAKELEHVVRDTRQTVRSVNKLAEQGGPLQESANNAKQFTDTIKRQPWRLIWKSTKKYPEEESPKEEPQKNIVGSTAPEQR